VHWCAQSEHLPRHFLVVLIKIVLSVVRADENNLKVFMLGLDILVNVGQLRGEPAARRAPVCGKVQPDDLA
jgi:hypothetical protein